jgi:SP family arabinose:H+ symporter-like MFS transporter
MALNRVLLKSAAVGSIGGFLFGFDTAVISGATHGISSSFSLSAAELGITVSSALWGTVLGCVLAGYLGNRIGGRNALRLMAVLYLLSALGCAFSPKWSALLIFRCIGGLGIGGSSVLGPVYISELAPASLRGRFVGLFQINICIGILCAYLSNGLIAARGLGVAEWRWELGVPALPALLFLFLLFGIPQSSRWLVIKGRIAEARAALQQLGEPNVEGELNAIVGSITSHGLEETQSLFVRRYRTPIFLAVAIGIFNQLSGINAILYYMNDIFEAAGFTRVSGNMQAAFVGLMNLAATLLAMSVIDRLGRRVLLLWGSVGTSLCLSGIAYIFLSHSHQQYLVWLLVANIFFFASSQGSVIWVYLSEIFPNRVRSKGQGLGSSAHWVMNAFISGIFPIMSQKSGGYPFVFFAVMMALQFFVVLFWFPETKGVSLEQLQKQLNIA